MGLRDARRRRRCGEAGEGTVVKVGWVVGVRALLVGVAAVTVGGVALACGQGRAGGAVPGATAVVAVGPQSGMMWRWSATMASGGVLKLPREHAKGAAAWWQRYREDPAGAEAQKAVRELCAQQLADMRELTGGGAASVRSG
jgi:hypothetical protein